METLSEAKASLKPEDNKFHKGNGKDGKHYWLIPDDVYNKLVDEHGPMTDVCPFPFVPSDFDGLVDEWGSVNWANVPFGATMHNGRKKGQTAWTRKAIAEFKKGKKVVMIHPLDKWVLMLIEAGARITNLGDVKFLATEDRTPGKGTGRHIACFVLDPKTAEFTCVESLLEEKNQALRNIKRLLERYSKGDQERQENLDLTEMWDELTVALEDDLTQQGQ